jgi:DNA invertase Pin-like site-specific DNA recombinase
MSEMKRQDGKPRVYSYTRFSTPEQAKGDSERRQIEAAQRYADQQKLTLDNSLKLVDRGLSGFKGTHRKGAFGAFLDHVKAGKVPRGSILLVENLDRLSREDFATQIQTVVVDILKQGIKIVTLSPQDEFTLENLSEGGAFRLVGYMLMGHAESKKKSERLRAAWVQKRRIASKNEMLTARVPAWFSAKVEKTVTGRVISREIKVIPEAAETIRLIFKLKLEGFGKNAIEKKLNKSAPWIPPGRKEKKSGWRASYIQKILRNPAVIGEFQPHRLEAGKRVPDGDPIPGYFEGILAPDVFYAVQKQIKSNHRTGGRTGKAVNVLKNLCRCGYCGGSAVFIDKGKWKYLVCDSGRRGVGCGNHAIDYFEVEQTVLDNCAKLKPEMVLPDSTQQAKETKNLQTRLAGLEAELTGLERQMDNLVDQISNTGIPALRERCEARFQSLEAKQQQLRAEQDKAEAELQRLERGHSSFEKWQKGLIGLKEAIRKDAETRIRLNTHLKEFIEKIEIFPKGHEDEVELAVDLVWEGVPEIARAPHFKSFRKYLTQRLLSADGRFFRVHFKGGAARLAAAFTAIDPKTRKCVNRQPSITYTGLQIAPPGSLAHRVEVRGKDRTRNGPEVGELCREFFDGRKLGFVPKLGSLR